MILETERLLLRPFATTDFDAIHSYSNNLENVRYMTWGPNNEEDTKSFLAECIQQQNNEPQTHHDFAVVFKGTNQVIGGCGIYLDESLKQGSLGWILHMTQWKNGYGTELARALIQFGFDELKLHRITATCDAENYGSYRVMERIGMRREGTFLQSRIGRENDRTIWYDQYNYAILAKEWHDIQKRDNLEQGEMQ